MIERGKQELCLLYSLGLVSVDTTAVLDVLDNVLVLDSVHDHVVTDPDVHDVHVDVAGVPHINFKSKGTEILKLVAKFYITRYSYSYKE